MYLLGALVNIDAGVDTIAAVAQGTRTRKIALRIRAVCIAVAIIRLSCRRRLRQRTLIDIATEETVSAIARLCAVARIPRGTDRPDEVGARSPFLRAEVRASGAFVDVGAADAVARVARRALAREGARKIGAVFGAAEAIMCAGHTFVDLLARRRARLVATHACACTTHEVRRRSGTACAAIGSCAAASNTARVTRGT